MGRGPGLSVEARVQIWERWKAGETLAQMSRGMHKKADTFLRVVRPHGGIAPRVRCRSARALTLAEREEISRGLCAHRSIREIARGLGRSPSRVSRESGRKSAQWWRYRAHVSDQRAWDRGMRPKKCTFDKD